MPTQSLDITAIPADLQRYVEANPEIITDLVQDGFQQLNNDFDVRYADDEEVITNMRVMDILRVATDDFTPVKAAEFGHRKWKMQDIDADIFIPRSQITSIAKSWLRNAKRVGSVQEVLDNPIETMFLREIIQGQGLFLRENSSWKGDADSAQTGSLFAVDGLLLKIIAGAGGGGDIPSAHTVAGPTTFTTDESVYDHIQAMCDKYADVLPRLAESRGEIRLSRRMKQRYDRGRRAKFPQSVGPQDVAIAPDDYENLVFVIDVGLAGKETVIITPPNNLFFGTDGGQNRLTIIQDVKGWKMNMFFRCAFDYAYGKFIVRNNKV